MRFISYVCTVSYFDHDIKVNEIIGSAGAGIPMVVHLSGISFSLEIARSLAIPCIEFAHARALTRARYETRLFVCEN